MKRIAIVIKRHISDIFHDSRLQKEYLTLSKAGYDVSIICYAENSNYRNDLSIDVDPIIIKDIVGFNNKFSSSSVKKTKRLFDKIISNRIYDVIYEKNLKEKLLSGNFDILLAHNLNTLKITSIVSKKLNIPLIYDSRELWPEVMFYNNHRIIKQLHKNLQKKYIKQAEYVITVSSSISKYLDKNYSLKNNTITIMNAPIYKDNLEPKNYLKEYFNLKEKDVILLYQGSFVKGRGIEFIINAFGKIVENNIKLVFMGKGLLKEYILYKAKTNNNILVKDAVEFSRVMDWVESADIGITSIEAKCLSYYYSLPNKFLEQIVAGIPVVATDLPEFKRILNGYSLGKIFEENNTESFVKAIKTVIDNYDLYRKNVLKNRKLFSWQNQEEKFLRIFKEVE